MCQLIVENGGDPELTQFGGHAFMSCDSIAPLFQVLRMQARHLPALAPCQSAAVSRRSSHIFFVVDPRADRHTVIRFVFRCHDTAA